MILAFDTFYYNDKAHTVCLEFQDWDDGQYSAVYREIRISTEEYESGAFYKKELPCILGLLEKINTDKTTAIVVDGFVYLNDEGRIGLGGHLYNALNKTVPVIGVAKTNFATIETKKRPVLRGKSSRPLYVTAIGMDLDTAASCITGMAGPHRIPYLLKELDRLTRVTD